MKSKRFVLVLVLAALAMPALAGCGRAPQVQADLTAPAARVPATAQLVYFFNVHPQGTLAEQWNRVRGRVVASPAGRESLDGLLQDFALDRYGLEELAAGPAVVATWPGTSEAKLIIVETTDEQAALDAALESPAAGGSEREEMDGRTVYYGVAEPERFAWTVDRGAFVHVSIPQVRDMAPSDVERDPLDLLQDVLSLAESDSLAALPDWRTVRARLPEAPIGLLFLNLDSLLAAERPSESSGSGLLDVISQEMRALALAAVPTSDGVRVDIAGIVGGGGRGESSPGDDAAHTAAFAQPPIDPDAWIHLPDNSALAILGHDASTVWPIMGMFLGEGWPDQLFHLEVNADLAGPGGPLGGELALAVTPPLPDQPVSRGIGAFQALILAHGTSPEQMDGFRTAMEGRGAVFGAVQAGVPVQVEAGTRVSGYALTYGFDGDTLLLGTSPTIVRRGVAAARARYGLAQTEAFRAVSQAWPAGSTLGVYLDIGQMNALNEANTSAGAYEIMGVSGLDAFRAIGVGLRLRTDGLEGVMVLLLSD